MITGGHIDGCAALTTRSRRTREAFRQIRGFDEGVLVDIGLFDSRRRTLEGPRPGVIVRRRERDCARGRLRGTGAARDQDRFGRPGAARDIQVMQTIRAIHADWTGGQGHGRGRCTE